MDEQHPVAYQAYAPSSREPGRPARAAVFAGPVAPRCRRPQRWLALAAALLAAAALLIVALNLGQYRVGPPSVLLPCELRLGPGESGGLTIIGDLHGDYPALLELLRHAGLIHPARANETATHLEEAVRAAREGNDLPAAAACTTWLGAPGHTLVQLGDVVDRGPGAAAVVACLRACQAAAPAAGGKVIRLVGNHELMWYQGSFRYAHDTGDPPSVRGRLVSNWTDEILSGQVLGAWATGPLLFVHAGLRPAMLDRLMRSSGGGGSFSSWHANATLASVVAGRISGALAATVARCAGTSEQTSPTRRGCFKLSDELHDGLLSAGPDRGGRGLGGPFWTDWYVLRSAEPTSSWLMQEEEGGGAGVGAGVGVGVGEGEGENGEETFRQWVWPAATVTRRADGSSVLEPSEANSFIQIVGHTPARCDAREDDRCEPIRARSDLAAIVTDAAISEYYGGNRAYVAVAVDAADADAYTASTAGVVEPARGQVHRQVGRTRRRLVAVVQGPGGKWRRRDLMAAACGGSDGSSGPASTKSVDGDENDFARTEGAGDVTGVGLRDDLVSRAIPLGPG
jgi:hypothetical protein